ncbi:MAG: hypothetical protein M3P27_01710 [Acidobacteriota bacterium]|nr:hypothetical protein [Acidobacteriota bacterium]
MLTLVLASVLAFALPLASNLPLETFVLALVSLDADVEPEWFTLSERSPCFTLASAAPLAVVLELELEFALAFAPLSFVLELACLSVDFGQGKHLSCQQVLWRKWLLDKDLGRTG